MGFTGYDAFKVYKKYRGDVSNYSLTNLYLPLIGVDAFSMYHLLTSLDNGEYVFNKLMDHLNINSASFLDETINKLEGIGLLEVYKNKNGYIFLLNEPLSFCDFMNNHILVEFLKGKIGLTEFNKLKVEVDLSGYKDVTKGFDEVYERTNADIKNIISPYFKRLSSSIQVKNDKFDYLYFKLKFDDTLVKQEALEIKELKDEILRISYHYNLNEDEMYDAVMMCVRINKDLKPKDILTYAQKIYSGKTTEVIGFKTKEADPFINDKLDSDTEKLITLCESISSEELLRDLSGIKPALSELKMIDDLIKNTGFPQGVINFMVLLVVNEKNGEIPSYNYFEKIANTWKRAKVKTTLDAINLVNSKKMGDGEAKPQRKVGKTIVEVPDWYSDYEKKLKEASKANEEKEVSERAKSLFSSEE